ncbi:MAG: sulfatase-like hydrolase/transferase, partial [Pseudohongiellaceae bacterium]
GLPRPNRSEIDIDSSGGKLDYPELADLSPSTSPNPQPYNIVWLVAESWRADSLNPRVMPNTHTFAINNLWFQEHYSGGNGTRMGMFTQFYGIYGSYWFDMLQTRTPPVLMNYLQQQGYQFKAFTSSAFTYPEFDKTIFSALPQESLVAYSEGHGWQRDQKNTTDMISFIESASEPFFTFMFFESSHANYYFPDEDIITSDYLEDFNYLTTDIGDDINRIHNRYRNATHHLDRQFARVFDALEQNGLMNNTIVIVTGDHGEEFMENGRWGHNSTFSQQQIRVPLLLHIPNEGAQRIEKMTSHLDLPATVLSVLHAGLPEAQFSFGMNLLDPAYKRDYTVVSDWHG